MPSGRPAPESPPPGAGRSPRSASTPLLPVEPQAELVPAAVPEVPGYEILSELGRGGMGVVFHARDTRLGREVALKMVLGGGLADSRGRASLRSEAEALAALGHPGIVRVFDVGEAAGVPYVALEYCPGGTLSGRLAGKPQAPRKAAAVMEEIARAVAAAHIHRDLKPGNILLDAEGRPRVTDFGLAKRLDTQGLTRTGEAKGTPAYMAPEQAEGAKGLGPTADVYSLGAMLYEMLTGRPPFLADSEIHLLYQLMQEEPVAVRRLAPRVPADLETICHKALAKNPARRYRHAGALADDLRRFRDHQPIAARPAGAAERAVKWVRRRPMAAALIGVSALAAVLLAAVVAAFTAEVARQRDAAERERDAAQVARGSAEAERDRADELRRQAEDARRQADAQRRRAEEAVAVARRHLYAADMTLAWQAWDNGLVGRAGELLERNRPAAGEPDFRGFEWHSLDRARRAESARLSAPDGQHPVTAAFSPDGSTVAVCGSRGGVRFWGVRERPAVLLGERRTPDRKPIGTWQGNAAAFSPDGRRLAASLGETTIRIWDAVADGPALELEGHTGVVCGLAFSPDGRHVISAADDKTIRFWSAADGKLLSTHKVAFGARLYRAAFSADRSRLAVGGGDHLSVWRLSPAEPTAAPTRLLEAAIPDEGKKGYVNVMGVGLSADGTLVTVGTQNVQQLWLFDVEKGTELAALKTTRDSGPSDVSLSPDGRSAAVCTGFRNLAGTVEIWDLSTRKRKALFRGHSDGTDGVIWSPDGKWVISCSDDGTARVWSADNDPYHRAGVADAKTEPSAYWLEYAAQTGTFAAATQEGMVVLGGDDLSLRVKPDGVVLTGWRTAAFSPEGQRIAVGSAGKVVVYDSISFGGRKAWEGAGPKTSCNALAFSPDGRWLAVGGEDPPEHLVRVYEADTGEEVARLTHDWYRRSGRNITSALAFSPDGRFLLVAAGSFYSNLPHRLLIWNTADGFAPHGQGPTHPGNINGLAFGADGTLVTACSDGNGRVWPPGHGWTGRHKVLLQGFADAAKHVTVSPDGRRVAMASSSTSGDVKIWDASDGRELGTLPHGGRVWRPAFAPDGLALAVAVAAGHERPSGGVRVWRIDPPPAPAGAD